MPFTSVSQLNNTGFTSASDVLIEKYKKEKKDGLLKTIAKDAVGTLLVKPAARATEAITRTIAPNSLAAKGYEAMADEGQSQSFAGIDVGQQKSFGEGGGRQVASDTLKTASYLFPYGKATGVAGKAVGKIGGNVASGAAGGYLADAGFGLADESQSTGQALTPGLGTAIGAAIPLAGPALRATGRATSKLGGKAVEAVIPNSSREAQILQTYKANNPFFKRVADVLKGTEKAPTTAGKTATTQGLMGTKSGIGVQANRASKKLWDDVIGPRLDASKQAVDLNGFFAKIENDIIESTPEVARQKSLLKALESYKKDYSGVNSVSLKKLQGLKEGWAEFVPEKFYKGENISGAANQVRGLLADESRQTIYSQLGDDVKQAYFDYGNLKGLQKYGQVSMTGAKLKGGTGGLISEILSQAITPIGTVGGQAVYKIGKGIEFVGNLGAKNLGEALGIQGGLKFPGDAAIDDIGASIKKAKSLPNKQGGFIKIGQDASLPTKTQTSQTASKVKNTVIPKSSTTTPKKSSPKGKGTIPENSLVKNVDERLKPLVDKDGMVTVFRASAKFPETLPVDTYVSTKPDSVRYYAESWYKGDPKNIKVESFKIPANKLKRGGSQDNWQLSEEYKWKNATNAKSPENSLIQEAKKYKSAEEFVKSQPTVYRGEGGSNVAQGKALLAEGKHYASDAEYPKGFGKVEEYVLKPKAKVLDLGDSTFAEISQKLGIPERNYISPKELASIAKEKGYDVVKYTGEYKSTGKQFIHTVDLTGDSYITKSQLTDIWNKTNKKVTLPKSKDLSTELVQQAKKYKSAEEYGKSIKDKFIKEQGFEPSSMNVVNEWWKAKQTQPYIGIGGANPEFFTNRPKLSELPKKEISKYLKFTPEGKAIYYRGIDKSVNTRDIRWGDFISPDKGKASFYGKVEKYEIDPKYVYQLGDLEAVYFNPKDKLKAPKPQSITDIWNKANKTKLKSSLVQEAKKYKSAEEFVKAQEAPKTVQVWNKSKFSNDGAYTERPVIRKVENKTLYQGGDDSRQFWTPDKKYAEQFGDVKEKTGTFYQIDNGNRMTEVYVDASKTKSQLTDIWKKSNK